jgi:hypothetical protein
MGSGI